MVSTIDTQNDSVSSLEKMRDRRRVEKGVYGSGTQKQAVKGKRFVSRNHLTKVTTILKSGYECPVALHS